MASSISTQSVSTLSTIEPTKPAKLPDAGEKRIESATKMSITPDYQSDAAVILSISGGGSASSVDVGFESLIYNASAAKSGMLNSNLPEQLSDDESEIAEDKPEVPPQEIEKDDK